MKKLFILSTFLISLNLFSAEVVHGLNACNYPIVGDYLALNYEKKHYIPTKCYTVNAMDSEVISYQMKDHGLDLQRSVDVLVRYPTISKDKLPVIFIGHGGASGSIIGQRKLANIAEYLASSGYITINIGFRSMDDSNREILSNSFGHEDFETFKYLDVMRLFDIQAVLNDVSNIDGLPQIVVNSLNNKNFGYLGHSAGSAAGMTLAGAKRDIGTRNFEFKKFDEIKSIMALSPQGPNSSGFFIKDSGETSWDNMHTTIALGTATEDITNGDSFENRIIPYEHLSGAANGLFYVDTNGKGDILHMGVALSFNPEDPTDGTAKLPLKAIPLIVSPILSFFDVTLKNKFEALDFWDDNSLVNLFIEKKSIYE